MHRGNYPIHLHAPSSIKSIGSVNTNIFTHFSLCVGASSGALGGGGRGVKNTMTSPSLEKRTFKSETCHSYLQSPKPQYLSEVECYCFAKPCYWNTSTVRASTYSSLYSASALSQSNCRNFPGSSIKQLILMINYLSSNIKD